MIRLIATDIDGTLLNLNRQVSDRTKEAIRLAQSRGVIVIPCSGRHFPGTRAIARQAGMKDALLCGNGAQARTLSGEVIANHPFSPEECLKIIDFAEKNGLQYNVYANDVIYSSKMNSVLTYYENLNLTLPENERCVFELCDGRKAVETNEHNLLKIELLRLWPAIRPSVRALLSALPVCAEGNFVSSVEVHAPGINKGTGLRDVAQKYGISLSETMAFGDENNDVDMLRMAGIGVAMGNGADCAKQAADIIAPDNHHDGVADVIERYIL